MTKEQLLQLVSEAYDDGAKIKIHLYLDTHAEADEVADQYAEYFEKPCHTDGQQRGGYWNEYEEDRVELVAFSLQKEESA